MTKPGRPFAVFDIDGTLIRWQLYHAIVDELNSGGHLPPELEKQIHDARMTWKKRTHSNSFEDYESTLVKVYHGALVNLDVAAYNKAVDNVFEKYKDQVYTYTRDLIRALKADGYILFVISGSPQEVVTHLGNYYGFDAALGTQYEQVDGHFNGKFFYGHKAERLQKLIEEHGASSKGSIGVGDSSSDIEMLELVETPIAFNPNQELLKHAQEADWKIVVERKNVIYELEKHDGQYLLAQTDS